METRDSIEAEKEAPAMATVHTTAPPQEVSLFGHSVELWKIKDTLNAITLCVPLCVAMWQTNGWQLEQLVVIFWAMYIPTTAFYHIGAVFGVIPSDESARLNTDWKRLEQQLMCAVLLSHTLVLGSGGWIVVAVAATLLAVYTSMTIWQENGTMKNHTRPAFAVMTAVPVILLLGRGELFLFAIACVACGTAVSIFYVSIDEFDVYGWRQMIINLASGLYTFAVCAAAWGHAHSHDNMRER